MDFDPPEPIRSGVRNNVLKCPMAKCPFFCRSYCNYEGHLESRHFCIDCAKFITDRDLHQCQVPGQRLGYVDAGAHLDLTDFYEYSRSHGGSMISYKYKHALQTSDIETAFSEIESSTKKLLKELYAIHTLSKVEISVGIHMEKEIVEENGEKGYKQALIYFKSGHYELQTAGSVGSILLHSASDIVEKKNTFIENGSGWYVLRIESFEIKLGEIRLFMNSKASGHIEMPFTHRQGHVNFKNQDNHCFKYCIAAAVCWDEQINTNRINGVSNKNLAKHHTWKKYFSRFNFLNVKEGLNIYKDLPLFEENNNIAVNVLSHRKGAIVMVRSSQLKTGKVVNLFLIHKKIKGEVFYHLALIQNLNKFLGYRRASREYFCERCFRFFASQNKCDEHAKVCGTDGEVEEKLPKEGEKLKFTRPELTLPYPYILYWDFECYSVASDKENLPGQKTIIDNKFEPASYSFCIVKSTEEGQHIVVQEYYDGENPVESFFERVFKHAQDILWNIRTTNNFVVPSAEEKKMHEDATHCAFCERKFTSTVNNETAERDGVEEQDEDDDDEEEEDDDDEEDDEAYLSLSNCKVNKNKYGLTNQEKQKVKVPVVRKTFHHSHENGKYIASLCSRCNLRIKFKHELVCVAHNSAGFDLHLLMRHLENPIFDVKDINVISKGTERFVQLEIPAREMNVPSLNYTYNMGHFQEKGWTGNRKVKLRFIDSCQFLPDKLSTLAEALKKEKAKTLNLVNESIAYIQGNSSEERGGKRRKEDIEEAAELLFEKLPYPYRYLSSRDVLKDGHPIPGQNAFNNELRNEACTDEEWQLVQKIIKVFNITDFRQFTRLYTTVDVLLLAVIWENFRRNGLAMYNLDPTYMCTGSGYSFQCFLYKTRTEIEYIRDIKMIKWLTRGIRGGTAFCTRKIETANNERCPNGYDPTKERTHIIYNDKVSLYATALLDKYPQSNYKWADQEELESIDWSTYNGEGDKGYFLEVDLGYPPDVQDITSDLPLAPEKRVVRYDELSSKQKLTMSNLGKNIKSSFITKPRLLLHCYDRENYILHYKSLRYYLRMGLTLKKIHAGISFTEKSYFRDYIELNINERKIAKSESMRQFLKNQNNQIFGKCLQSNKNNVKIKFCGSRAISRKYLTKPECKDFLPLTENVSIVMLRPTSVMLDKPIQAGVTVLDLAKVIFYEGYYQQLKAIFGDRISNAYVDTDSSIGIVRDPNNTFWDDLVENRQYFDFSKIPEKHDFFKKYSHLPDLRQSNAGVAGKWKVENFDISSIILVKAKQYSIKYYNDREEKKCKGITATALRAFTHEQYADVVRNDKVVKLDVKYIRSVKHTLYCITVNKVAFHNLDISRVYCKPEDINFSLPLGHYRLKNYAL